MRLTAVAAASVAGALLLAGCSGGDGPTVTATVVVPTHATGGPSPSATHTPLEASDVYVDTVNSQAEGDFQGAASDVTAQSCEASEGTWLGSGTLTNPTDATVDYRVWVAFLNPSGDTVGLVQSNADGVKPGKTGEYAAAMPYVGADALTCVLRVERRAAA